MPETSVKEPSAMSTYSNLKRELLRCIDDMLAIESIRGCPCEELREKVETNEFNLVVVGDVEVLVHSVAVPILETLCK